MTRRDRFRARGARGASGLAGARSPQISDGVFQGATEYYAAGTTPVKPTQDTVIAWAPSAFPGVELWCYRLPNTPGSPDGTYRQLGVDQIPAGPGDDPPAVDRANYLWLDQIPKDDEFVPPTGKPPESLETIEALRAYASARWILTHGRPDVPLHWKVTLNRPFQAPSGDQATRIQHDKVYAVYQEEVPGGGQNLLTGWLWVPYDEFNPPSPVGREIWLHYEPNEPGGFGVVGATPNGLPTPYTKTRLYFEDWTPANGESDEWSLLDYQDATEQFTTWAMSHDDNPAADASQLELLDYRVTNLI